MSLKISVECGGVCVSGLKLMETREQQLLKYALMTTRACKIPSQNAQLLHQLLRKVASWLAWYHRLLVKSLGTSGCGWVSVWW